MEINSKIQKSIVVNSQKTSCSTDKRSKKNYFHIPRFENPNHSSWQFTDNHLVHPSIYITRQCTSYTDSDRYFAITRQNFFKVRITKRVSQTTRRRRCPPAAVRSRPPFHSISRRVPLARSTVCLAKMFCRQYLLYIPPTVCTSR